MGKKLEKWRKQMEKMGKMCGLPVVTNKSTDFFLLGCLGKMWVFLLFLASSCCIFDL